MKQLFLIAALILLDLFRSNAAPCGTFGTKDSLTIQLVPVSGKKFYRGKSDCSATAKVAFRTDAIRIDVHVEDDQLVFNDDPIHSDHVEVWLAVPEAESEITSYILTSDVSLWLVNDTADVQMFNAEVRDPLVSSSLFRNDVRYHALDTMENYGIKDDVDFELESLRKSTNERTRLLFGQTHFGFLPTDTVAYLYDEEFLPAIERGMQNKIADVTTRVKYKTSLHAHSYDMSIEIPSSALAYLSEQAMSKLLFLIDVVDVDRKGREEKLLSTSEIRRWGEADTYNSIKLDFPFGDRSLMSRFPPQALENIVRPVYFNSAAGWLPVAKKSAEISYPHRLREHSLPNLKRVDFVIGESSCRTDTLDGKPVRIYSTSNPASAVNRKDIVVLNNGQCLTTEQCVGIFRFPSGNIGLLTGKYRFYMGGCFASGMCGCNIEAYLVLRRNPSASESDLMDDQIEGRDEMVLAHWSGCAYETVFDDSLQFDDSKYDVNFADRIHGGGIEDFGYPFEWGEILTWIDRGKSLVVNLGKGIRVEANIDEKNWTVAYKRL